MAFIPAGTILVSGYGDPPGLFTYLSPDGTITYPQPDSTPTPGSGVSAMCRLSTSDIALVGGGGSDIDGAQFPTTGAGVYHASDLTKRSELAFADGQLDNGHSITADGLGYWYILDSNVGADPSDPSRIVVSRLDADAHVVQSWDIALPPTYNGYVDFPRAEGLAIAADGHTIYVGVGKVERAPALDLDINVFRWYVHQFDLSGAGSYVRQLSLDYQDHPFYQSFLVVPDGSGDVIVSYGRFQTGSVYDRSATGLLRRYTPSGTVVWTAGTPTGPGPFYWEALAVGLPGDPHFLAWAYTDDDTSSSARYVWFDYATGTPDNTRNFAPDDGAGFEFDSVMVILSVGVGPVPSGVPGSACGVALPIDPVIRTRVRKR